MRNRISDLLTGWHEVGIAHGPPAPTARKRAAKAPVRRVGGRGREVSRRSTYLKIAGGVAAALAAGLLIRALVRSAR